MSSNYDIVNYWVNLSKWYAGDPEAIYPKEWEHYITLGLVSPQLEHQMRNNEPLRRRREFKVIDGGKQ